VNKYSQDQLKENETREESLKPAEDNVSAMDTETNHIGKDKEDLFKDDLYVWKLLLYNQK
jgi:hypothetical protein